MEPLTSGAIAVATLILNKASEKIGEKLGETVTQQVNKLLLLIKDKSLPKTTAIEQAEQVGDYGKAVLELETAASQDSELAQTIQEIETSIKADPILLHKIQKTAQAVKNEPTLIQNNTKLAEKIGLLVQGGTVNIDNLSF